MVVTNPWLTYLAHYMSRSEIHRKKASTLKGPRGRGGEFTFLCTYRGFQSGLGFVGKPYENLSLIALWLFHLN